MKTVQVVSRAIGNSAILLSMLLWAGAVPAETGTTPTRQQMQEMMQQQGGGYGPGMMGMGQGMMVGGMGMMGGGMGPGMMGGGVGMMGGGMGPVGMLDLTDDQRSKINKLTDDHRKKDWELGGRIMDEQARLRDLYDADTLDAKKIGAVHGAIAKIQQQAIEANVELQNRIQAVLTKEQREQLKQWRRGMGTGMMGPGGRGGYGPGGMMGR